ncbi:uncharacterized protein LOC111318677 [Durio zibethinus]|uniref:Uncharacterized protein LOC111318677 n=1 Tax=Durio zibethinus TaxID=66656 RepID=A0A6P6BJQ7_DURZI|nr:uncharacterized protein LOC111318677 [Durio zibethinus]
MADAEFQESDVIFSDHSSKHYSEHDEDAADNDDGHLDYQGFSKNGPVSRNYNKKSRKNNSKKKLASGSLPVNIPRHHHGGSVFHCGSEADDFEEDEEGEIVPPHVILGRRIAGKMAFSVCTGNGRTLKGRDLSQVRNSILRMTGFLEA